MNNLNRFSVVVAFLPLQLVLGVRLSPTLYNESCTIISTEPKEGATLRMVRAAASQLNQLQDLLSVGPNDLYSPAFFEASAVTFEEEEDSSYDGAGGGSWNWMNSAKEISEKSMEVRDGLANIQGLLNLDGDALIGPVATTFIRNFGTAIQVGGAVTGLLGALGILGSQAPSIEDVAEQIIDELTTIIEESTRHIIGALEDSERRIRADIDRLGSIVQSSLGEWTARELFLAYRASYAVLLDRYHALRDENADAITQAKFREACSDTNTEPVALAVRFKSLFIESGFDLLPLIQIPADGGSTTTRNAIQRSVAIVQSIYTLAHINTKCEEYRDEVGTCQGLQLRLGTIYEVAEAAIEPLGRAVERTIPMKHHSVTSFSWGPRFHSSYNFFFTINPKGRISDDYIDTEVQADVYSWYVEDLSKPSGRTDLRQFRIHTYFGWDDPPDPNYMLSYKTNANFLHQTKIGVRCSGDDLNFATTLLEPRKYPEIFSLNDFPQYRGTQAKIGRSFFQGGEFRVEGCPLDSDFRQLDVLVYSNGYTSDGEPVELVGGPTILRQHLDLPNEYNPNSIVGDLTVVIVVSFKQVGFIELDEHSVGSIVRPLHDLYCPDYISGRESDPLTALCLMPRCPTGQWSFNGRWPCRDCNPETTAGTTRATGSTLCDCHDTKLELFDQPLEQCIARPTSMSVTNQPSLVRSSPPTPSSTHEAPSPPTPSPTHGSITTQTPSSSPSDPRTGSELPATPSPTHGSITTQTPSSSPSDPRTGSELPATSSVRGFRLGLLSIILVSTTTTLLGFASASYPLHYPLVAAY